ncbi:MAG: NAD(+) diphosphatase [Sphaerochaetaceae bacterium]|nr:NAD(+) diphosphatase [Spirochaetales bacterium]MDY5499258.1 NAD(+) diphosphatase [Sphaerochaetaceae bacterium]
MIQDIAPHQLDNHWHPCEPKSGDYLFHFKDKRLLLSPDGSLPRVADIQSPLTYLFTFDEVNCWLSQESEGENWIALRETKNLPDGLGLAAATAWQLNTWYEGNRFCGHCGKPMALGTSERSLVCPSCGTTIYPKIMPAVIIGLWNGNRILMTRYAISHSAYRGRALIAGFVEIGESAEETVRREVMEEVGLSVRDIRYFASQPWGSASDLLLGYFCHLDKSSSIHLDATELEDAEWVGRDEIDPATDTVSLTGTMIRYFKDHPERFPF